MGYNLSAFIIDDYLKSLNRYCLEMTITWLMVVRDLKHHVGTFRFFKQFCYQIKESQCVFHALHWTYHCLDDTKNKQTDIIFFDPHKLQMTDHICYLKLGL